jgi:ketosteroid isomerase-like protein
MSNEHPNIVLMQQLDLGNLAAAKDVFAEDVVWHYFNPNLPDMQGDYVGLDGIRSFFEAIGQKSRGTFKVQPVSTTAVGDELVVVQTRNTLTFQGHSTALDVVVVWRFVDGRIVEVWDIVPGRPAEAQDERR